MMSREGSNTAYMFARLDHWLSVKATAGLISRRTLSVDCGWVELHA
mgnify:CR=1 FL=1